MQATESVFVAPAPLSAADVQEVNRLESVIRDWRKGYAVAGTNLSLIRQRCWFYHTHRTWEAYLHERWGLSFSSWQRLRDAAAVADIIEAAGLPIPGNATIAVEMCGMEPEQVLAVWREYLARVERGGRAGATLLQAVKQKLMGAAAGVKPDGSIDQSLADLLAILPPSEVAEVIALSEKRSQRQDEKPAECPWAIALREIKAGLRKLEHDEAHRKQFQTVLSLLQRIANLLKGAAA